MFAIVDHMQQHHVVQFKFHISLKLAATNIYARCRDRCRDRCREFTGNPTTKKRNFDVPEDRGIRPMRPETRLLAQIIRQLWQLDPTRWLRGLYPTLPKHVSVVCRQHHPPAWTPACKKKSCIRLQMTCETTPKVTRRRLAHKPVHIEENPKCHWCRRHTRSCNGAGHSHTFRAATLERPECASAKEATISAIYQYTTVSASQCRKAQRRGLPINRNACRHPTGATGLFKRQLLREGKGLWGVVVAHVGRDLKC